MLTIEPSTTNRPAEYIDLNSALLPRDLSRALVVKIEEDSLDFQTGDLLIVDTNKIPILGLFVVFSDHTIAKWELPDFERTILGVVTSVTRQF